MSQRQVSRMNVGVIVACVSIGYLVGKVVSMEMSDYPFGVRLTAEIAAVGITALVAYLVTNRIVSRSAD